MTGLPVTPYFLSMNDQIVESIQSSGFKACLVVTGGGSGAVHTLLAHAGASRFVFDVQIPYSREAMGEYLGESPSAYCSEETAVRMAEAAFHHASRFTDHALGISCTAALATVSDRDDSDRAFLCFHSLGKVEIHKVEFSGITRSEQEEELSWVLIQKLYNFVC